jgi:O-antigen/teichoic acid export membrane protein
MMGAVVVHAGLRYVAAWAVGLRSGGGPWVRPGGWREQLGYAVPFGLAGMLAVPQQNAHLYVVAGAVGPALYALYRVGCFQLPVVDLLYTPISEVLMVRLGELERAGRTEEGVVAFREASGRLAYALLPWATFLFAAAPEFIGTLFGARFLPAVPLFRVSVVGVVLSVLPLDGVLRARGRTRGLLGAYALKAAVTVPLVVLAVRWWGMTGGVLSWVLAEAVGKSALLVQVLRALSAPGRPVRPLELLPWRELGRAALAACLAAVAVFALRAGSAALWSGLPEGLLWRILPLGVAAVLFAGGYVAALHALGVRPVALLAGLRSRRAQ